MENSRRDFLKKSAVAGGVVWASPVLLSVHPAAAAGTPNPGCPGACDSGALAVSIFVAYTGPPFTAGISDPAGDGTFCVSDLAPVSGDPISATLVCGGRTGCRSEASVETLVVEGDVPITANAITSSADATNGCPTGTVSLVNANIAGVPVDGTPAPNTTIPVITEAGVGTLVLNEQTCQDGELVVRAVHLIVPDPTNDPNNPSGLLTEIILAESRAGNACCPDCGLSPVPAQ